jgi:hypothetical protein
MVLLSLHGVPAAEKWCFLALPGALQGKRGFTIQ